MSPGVGAREHAHVPGFDPRHWIEPRWDVPARVRAVSSTRLGPGVSSGPFERFNLGSRSGDDPAAVRSNRAALAAALELPSEPGWLRQVHGRDVAVAAGPLVHEPEADAAVTRAPGVVLAILSADCLPVLLASDAGDEIAAAHAGWRGMAAGVIEATLARLRTPPARLRAWLGPAIGADAYPVGDEVRAALCRDDPDAAGAFRAAGPGRWHCDLYALARRRLAAHGVASVHGGEHCTFRDAARFYSYRRDGETGRMATLLWIA